MTIVLAIAAVSILVSVYFIRSFVLYRSKVTALNSAGTAAEGLLLEVRNLGLQQNSSSKMSEIAVKFLTASGKEQVVRHRKQLADGEVIPVGSTVEVTYLEADPAVCHIPSLGLAAQNKWTSLVTGLVVLIAGLFVAYVVFINLGTV